METILKDLKHSLRMFSQNPGFTIAAVLALALGIGANTAIFSVVNAVLLKPLTYPEPDRIVQFLLTSPNGSGPGASVPKFALWRARTDAFQDVSAYDFAGPGLNLTGDTFPEQVKGIHVTVDYFKLFGARIERGRAFTQQEDSPHGPLVALISDSLWRHRYAADPNLVGRSIELGGEPYTVVGIVGPEFHFNSDPDVWIPFQFDLNSSDQAHYFIAAGRLKPGVTLETANAQLKLAVSEFHRRFPGPFMEPKDGFSVQPLRGRLNCERRTSIPMGWRRPSALFFSSPVPMWLTCCLYAQAPGNGRSLSVPPLERAEAALPANFLQRAFCCRLPAGCWALDSALLQYAHCSR